MAKADRIALTRAQILEARVAEFIGKYEALCKEYGLIVGITAEEEFVVVAPADMRSLCDRLERQTNDMKNIPHQEW